MKPGSKPLCLVHAIRAKVQAELKRMETLGVLSKVTPWCAVMVVVLKGTGAVTICVDLKSLNILPKVENTLAQLSRARV